MEPLKQRRLVLELRQRIAKGRYPGGFRLPTELEFAKELGVARETLRGALKILEEDRLLKRIPRRGTFISADAKVKEPLRQLYLLVPCPDYFTKSNYATRQNLSELLAGVLAVAHKQHAQVITLPLSMVNTQEDIAWDRLACLDADSLVIFQGNWFSTIYPLLKERKCKVAHIHGMRFEGSEFESYVRQWYRINLNVRRHYVDLIRELATRGCRRIAISEDYLFDPINPILQSYRDGLAEVGQAEELVAPLAEDGRAADHLESIHNFYRKTHFDALICSVADDFRCDYHRSLNANLGLPASVQLVTKRQYEFNNMLQPKVPFLQSDFRHAAELAVEVLLSEHYAAGETLMP
ncbi:MAG: winged helix-turn-helix transcriptional regulator [Victivallales bacterium]|nr:winged helix-turn-helix transcriptional regulator [Victivallales bacterium]